jgi:hypothetical protein
MAKGCLNCWHRWRKREKAASTGRRRQQNNDGSNAWTYRHPAAAILAASWHEKVSTGGISAENSGAALAAFVSRAWRIVRAPLAAGEEKSA